jgi:hypothetical protein
MATLQSIANEISRISGIPDSTLRTIARRLGEAGQVPRGSRGKALQHLGPRDCAHLIVGAMRVSDGILGAAARVDHQVREVEQLRSQGQIEVEASDGSLLFTSERGSFIDQLGSMITQEPSQLLAAVAAVGLTTGANGVWGWVELRCRSDENKADPDRVDNSSGVPRVIFANGKVDRSGLTREVRMTSEALCEIAFLCRRTQSGLRDG